MDSRVSAFFPQLLLHRFLRGGGFRLLLAPAFALAQRHPFPEDADEKGLLVLASAFGEQLVNRAARRDGLEQFLEMTFRINIDRFHFDLRQIRRRQREKKTARGREIGIEIDRAQQRFEGIGQGGSSRPAAAGFFAAAHHEILPELELQARDRRALPARRGANAVSSADLPLRAGRG